MSGNFFLTESLFFIIYTIALLILREFIVAKDGTLRILMIAYFSMEVFTYGYAAYYFAASRYRWPHVDIDTYRMTILIPKAGIKLLLLRWLIKSRTS